MAKESMKAREVKRAKMAAKYANKRAALKEIVRKGDPEAARKSYPSAQPLQTDRTSQRLHPHVRSFPYPVP